MMLDGGNDDRDRPHFAVDASYQVLTEESRRADGVTIPDAHLLFNAEFKRTGDDLRLTGSDGKVHVVTGYFKSDNLPALLSPDGATLRGDLVAALAGPASPGKYAATEAPQPAMQAIGHAVRIEGHVSVMRNGVAVTINNGDVLLRGDVVQTAGDGVAGLVFNDGSAFQIGHDSRLVLSEFSYDPSGYLQVFNLVQGSFSFVSGKIAKLGDMRIGTPVASTKVTGSAGGGDIASDDGAVTLSIFAQDDGLHQATAYDRNGDTIATISSDGGRWVLKPAGPSQLAADEQPKTEADKAAEFAALNNILQIKGLADQYGSSSPASNGARGSSTPPGEFTDPGFGKLQPDGSNPSGSAFGPDSGAGPANGGTSGSPVFIFLPQNQAPVLVLNAGPAALEQTPVAIAPGLTLSDIDSKTLLQATFKITGNFRPGEDVLSFVNTARIQGAFDPATGTLTLSARPGQETTVADFEAALRSVTYTDTSDNPSPLTRTLTLTVQDADGTANGGHDTTVATLSLTVTPINDVPVITAAQAAGAVREDIAVDSHGQLHVEGTVDFRDVDLTDMHVVSAHLVSSTNTGGVALGTMTPQLTTETVNGLGGKVTWQYLADNAGVQFLRAGQAVTETYAVTISDGHGGLATQNVVVTITGSEDGPLLADGSGAAAEDADAAAQQVALAGSLSVTDLDVGDTLTASIVNSPAVTLDGQAFVLPAGASSLIDHALSFQPGVTSNGGVAHIDWTYDPSAANLDFLREGQNLVLTYTVDVSDGLLNSGTQTLSITITGTDDVPIIAAGAGAAIDEATDAHAQVISLAGALAVTDLDAGDTLTASVVGAPTVSLDGHAFTLSPDAMSLLNSGAFAVDNSGGGHSSIGGVTNIGWTYQPGAANLDFLKQGQTLTLTYAVVVNDGTADSAAQNVTITINGRNDAPVSVADGYTTDEDTPLLVPVSGLLSNDTDADGDVLSSILLSGPAHGTLALNADGTFTYTPFANYNGADSFTYTANDGLADSASATVDITINAVNDPAIVSGTSNGAVLEAGGVNNASAGTPTVTGTLTDTDVDNPANSFTAVGAATASVRGYGTWTMTSAGLWTYNLDNNNPTVQALNVGATLTDTFTVTTIDGTAQVVTITITGANDAAVLSADVRNLAETDAVLSTGGTLTISDVDSAATFVEQAGTIGQYGTFTIGADGAWTYVASSAHNEFAGGQTYTDIFIVTSADGTTSSVTIKITGSNDPALVSGAVIGSVVEAGGAGNAVAGTPSATGTLGVADVDNPGGGFAAVSTATASSDGYGTWTITSAGVWTYNLNNNNAAVQALNAGATLTDTFTVTTIDGTPQLVAITIAGANDAAVLSADVRNLAETNAVLSTSGTLTISDVDSPATFVAQANTAGQYGTFNIGANGGWTYVASSAHNEFAGGQTYTDTFAVTSADGTTSSVTVNMTGSNDPASVAGTISGAVIEAGGVNNAVAGSPTATGTLTDSDVDNPANSFTVVAAATTSASGYGTYTMTAAGVWTYTLNNNNPTVQALNAAGTLTDTFTVNTIDGTAQLVTVTIGGTNDAAVLSANTSNLTETNAVLTTGGTLTVSDVDSSATFVAQPNAIGQYGNFTIAANGVWSYVASSAHNEFVGGQTYTDAFAVASADGTTSSVTVKITGTNDPATVTGTSSGTVVEAGFNNAGTPTATGTLTLSDVDSPVGTFVAVAATASTGGYGTWTMTSQGVWSYALDNNNATVQALNAGSTLTDSFTVTTSDNVTKVVTVSIAGADDIPPVLVHNAAELNAALLAASAAGPNSNYLIRFANDISISPLGTNLTAINLAANSRLVIDGAGHTLDGANAYRGLFVFGGNVAINNLDIAHTLAQGGAGGTVGGGGGAGLGGGLFVAAGANVTIDAVTFTDGKAKGGAGGSFHFTNGTTETTGGGGGGMGTAGGSVSSLAVYTVGGTTFFVRPGSTGGTVGLNVPGHANYSQGALGGRSTGGWGSVSSGGDGAFGGGGGGGAISKQDAGSGRLAAAAGDGGFGGGGGAVGNYAGVYFVGGVGGSGGFGGGGGRSASGLPGGAGGFGGGEGGSFGGGSGGHYGSFYFPDTAHRTAGGGGGLGAGGAVFVQEGGSLTFGGGSISGNAVTGGLGNAGGGNGQALGAGIFIQGNQDLAFAPGAGADSVISDVIADQGGDGGSGHVTISGAGVVHFAAANTYVGGTTINSGGTLAIDAGGRAGTGAIVDNGTLRFDAPMTVANAISGNGAIVINTDGTVEFQSSVAGTGTFNFGAGHAITAVFDSGAPIATIKGFDLGDTIDIRFAVVTSFTIDANNVVTLKNVSGAAVATLRFDSTQHFDGVEFALIEDGNGGTNLRLAQRDFTVSTAAELNAALTAVSQGGNSYAANLTYTIRFSADISLDSLSTNLAAINLANSSTLLIDGDGHTLDGAGTHRGFFQYAGTATFKDMTIAHTLAQGGAGGIGVSGGGGGGAGLGGGLFVGVGASAIVDNVVFAYNSAHGGDGGGINAVGHAVNAGGGGGGLGANGAPGGQAQRVGLNDFFYAGGTGGGTGLANLSPGINAGGTGGSAEYVAPGNYGWRAYASQGGFGGFGGGGGGGSGIIADDHVSGGANEVAGGSGGFGGGGGGGGSQSSHAVGGFGGGSGGSFGLYSIGFPSARFAGGVGGGGLGAGGGIFVQEGGSLTIAGGALSGGTAVGGAAGPNPRLDHGLGGTASGGAGLGNGIFIQGNQSITLSAVSGETLTIADVIADEGGYHPNGTQGWGAVHIKGTGIVEFDAANTYVGGTTIDAGATLLLGAGGKLGTGMVINDGTLHFTHAITVTGSIVDNNAVIVEGNATYVFAGTMSGAGSITFGTGSTTLAFNSGVPTPVIRGFGIGDVIDLTSVSATGVGSYVNGILTLTGTGGSIVGTLNFDPAQQDLISTGFRVVADGSGGTYVVLDGIQTVFEVSTLAEFLIAVRSISNGGVNAAGNTAYTININANLAVTELLPAIELAAGGSLTIHGLGHSIDGAVNGVATFSGLYLRSGDLTLSDLTIQNTVQRGGDGVGDQHSTSGGGGGGLGAGGGLFVGAGASATLDNVSFAGDQAIGGRGGNGYQITSASVLDGGRAYGGLFQGRYNAGFGIGGKGGMFFGAGSGGFGAGGGGAEASTSIYGYSSGNRFGGIGGYAAGSGGASQTNGFRGGGGGGGAGLGGAVFVNTGGSLTISNGSFSGNTANGNVGGAGRFAGNSGTGLGGALFNNGSEIVFAPDAGETLTIADSIAGSGVIDITGAGNVIMSGAITGSQTINITGSGDVTFGAISGSETLNVAGSGDVVLSGPVSGTPHITFTGTGTLILPIEYVGAPAALVTAISHVNIGGILSVAGVHYHEFDVTADIAANTGYAPLNLAAGDTLTVKTAGHIFNGATNGAGGDFHFASTAAGGGFVLLDNAVPTFSVASITDLTNVLYSMNNGPFVGFWAVPNTNYVINLTTDIGRDPGIPLVNLAPNDTLTINLSGHSYYGATSLDGSSFVFASTASGSATSYTGDAVPTFFIGTASDLAWAISAINIGGLFSGTNIDYAFNLTADASLAGMPPINLASGDTLTINLDGHAFHGATNGTGTSFIFAPNPAGGAALFTGHAVPTFSVGTAAELAAALAAINSGGVFAAANTNYEIDLTGDLALTASLPAIKLAAGSTLTINGAGHTIDGSVNGVPTYSAFDLQSGNLVMSDLVVEGMLERGGAGQSLPRPNGTAEGAGGGGGLGAGGGLFVAAGASATLDNVDFTGNSAIGGAGGGGGYTSRILGSGAGGLLNGHSGGFGNGGSGVGRYANVTGDGGFGGGGGGGSAYGFGTRVGGYGAGNGGIGGFRSSGGGGGGAGLGGGVFVALGGSLTIEGGSISGNSVAGGNGNGGGSNGQGIGTGLFTLAQNVTLTADLGETLTISDTIAGGGSGVIHVAGTGNVVLSGAITGTTIDISNTGTVVLPAGNLVNDSVWVSGSAHFTLVNNISGNGSIRASGSAMLTITGTNLLTGGMWLDGTSTIDLASAGAAGNGIITFAPNAGATLIIEAGMTPANQINGFNPGDTIKLAGFAANATVTLGAGNVLTVTDGVHTANLHLNPGVNFSKFQFSITPYADGVMLTDSVPLAITAVIGQPVYGSGVHLQGSGAPNATISIIVNGGTTVLGTGIVDASGNFDLITSPLANGTYTFQAVMQAGGGAPQTSAGFTVDVHPSAPVITTLVTSHPLNGDTVELNGSGLPNETIKLYLDGSSTVFATTTTDANGNFNIVTSALIDGAHTFTATGTDSNGFTSPLSTGFAVNVWPTAPVITALIGQPVNGGGILIKGTGQPDRSIAIYADDGVTLIGVGSTNASGQFQFTTSAGLPNGVHTLTAATFDSSNLFSTASNTISINVFPSAPVITTLVGQPDNDGNIHVKGTAQPNQTITLYADGGTTVVGTGVTNASGQFDITTTLTFDDGIHRLTATATDSFNFTSAVSSQFTVNVIPDTPVITSVTAIAGTTQQIQVQGTGEAGHTIKLYADGGATVLATGVVDQFGHFDIVTNISGGVHTIRATETDSVNLVSAISSGVSVGVTPSAPAITELIGQPVNHTTVTVKGTGHDVGATITLYADGGSTPVGTGTVAANGTFTITTSVTFEDAVHLFTAVETDDGISSAASSNFTVNVNPTAPAITAQVGTATQGGTLELVGTGEAGNTITLKIAGVTIGTGVVDETGHFHITTNPGLNPGVQLVTAVETDAALLTSTATGFYATVAPVAPVVTSVVSAADPAGRVAVSGTGAAGDTVTLYVDGSTVAMGSGVVDQTGHFTIYSTGGVAVGAGAHSVTVTQTLVNGAGAATSAASSAADVNVVTVANSFTIANGADLAVAIAAIDLTGAYSQPNTHYTFNIVGDLKLTGQLPAFNLASGDTLTIHGNGFTLDANGLPGLFVYAGAVDIDHLSIVNATTVGGGSVGGGGAGAGLGGGLFIASTGAVTLDSVSFAHNRAVGGTGGYDSGYAGSSGGGGGMGGDGRPGGGGGIGLGAVGSSPRVYGTGPGAGIVLGAAPGGNFGGSGGGGGSDAPVVGWGFMGLAYAGASGGGIGGSAGSADAGGAGGFGGGGGAGLVKESYSAMNGGAGGFGGGGGAAPNGGLGGAGGFGGGGGVSGGSANGASGGFGGGHAYQGVGGSGLGAGGAIFIQQGGSLTFAGSGGAQGNGVGAGGGYYPQTRGSAFGSGIFLQGNQSITFAPDAAQAITISDVIADMTGSHDISGQTGAGHLVLDGEGTLVLGATNTFTGGITIEDGTLDLTAQGAAGTGAIVLSAAHHAAVEFSAAHAPTNAIEHFGTREQIVIDGFQATAVSSYSNGVLVLDSAAGSLSLKITGEDLDDASDFQFVFDSNTGATTITGGPDRSGTDVLHYGAGAHFFTGGAGDDVFYFRDTELSAGVTNRITDLSWANGSGEHDRIHLEGIDPDAVTVTSVNGGHDVDIGISVAGGGTAHILVQGVGSGPLEIEFQNTTPTSDANLNTLLTPSTVNETIGSYYVGANPAYKSSLVNYGADGSVIDRDVTNNDGSHTVTVQGANAALTASAASDTFVFQFSQAANATIGNFDVAHDVLQLSPSAYASVAAALAAISGDPNNGGNPADTYIQLDAQHSVTLTGVAPSTLAPHAFLLV